MKLMMMTNVPSFCLLMLKGIKAGDKYLFRVLATDSAGYGKVWSEYFLNGPTFRLDDNSNEKEIEISLLGLAAKDGHFFKVQLLIELRAVPDVGIIEDPVIEYAANSGHHKQYCRLLSPKGSVRPPNSEGVHVAHQFQ
jgi:hypothetical protein